MPIATEQNKTGYIELLKAQRFIYSRAKILGSVRVAIAFGAVIAAPFVLVFFPKSELVVMAVGAGLTLVSEQWIEGVEDKLKTYGAKIQEQFDTGLFELPWNDTRVGDPLEKELIHSFATRYRSGLPLSNWYPDTTGIPYPLTVIICQRANIVWDWRLRQHFATAIILVTLLWIVVVVSFGLWKHQELQEYLLVMIFPALPAISQAVKAYRGQLKNAADKLELQKTITSMWKRALEDPATVSVGECRGVQDRIYDLRKEGPMVPDAWFRMLRNSYEDDMQISSSALIEEAQRRIANKP